MRNWVKLQKWQTEMLGHVSFLYVAGMPGNGKSPAEQFVRLDLLAHVGMFEGIRSSCYKLFAVCPALCHLMVLCLWAVGCKRCVRGPSSFCAVNSNVTSTLLFAQRWLH